MRKQTGRKYLAGLWLVLFGIAIGVGGTIYVLFLVASSHPDHLWLGRFYWLSIGFFVGFVVVFGWIFFRLLGRLFSALRGNLVEQL